MLVGERTGSPTAQVVEALYGVPTILPGGALLVAGIGVLRGGRVLAHRWALFVTGAWVPVALVPGLTAGFTAGRAVIGAWMLLLGRLFLRAARRATGRQARASHSRAAATSAATPTVSVGSTTGA